jgi:uncharacterized surface protein with fasciclin (FAS1) repeats
VCVCGGGGVVDTSPQVAYAPAKLATHFAVFAPSRQVRNFAAVPTLDNGEKIHFTVADGTITVNYASNVTTADIVGSNGVVHIINQVLLPSTTLHQLSESA